MNKRQSGEVSSLAQPGLALNNKVKEIMEEVALIAKHEGVVLRDTIVEESLNKTNDFPYETKTSFQRDYEQKGKKNEADLFGGTILRLGRKHGIPTPVTDAIYTYIQGQNQYS